MGKIKSAIALVLITILIAGLCFMCTASFSYGTENINMFNNFLVMAEKDPKLGNALSDGYTTADGRSYIGGGYTAVYYPEGVISSQEYTDNLAALQDAGKDEEATEYEQKYVSYGSLYLEKEEIMDEDGETVSAEFKANFAGAVAQLRARVDGMHLSGAAVSVRDEYSVQVFLPVYESSRSTLAYIFSTFASTGEFNIGYGDSASTATKLELDEESGETIRDYVKSATSRTANGTSFVQIRFTNKGKKLLSSWTAGAADSSVTLYFFVGETAVISLQMSEQISQKSLYISGGYTPDAANAVALTIDSALKTGSTDLTFTLGETVMNEATFGNLAFTLLLIAFAVFFVALLVFFFVRYRALGLANLYTSLIYLLLMIVLTWGLPLLGLNIRLGIETFLAVAFGALLLAASNYITFESAKKEYAYGKTMASSVKSGYKRSFFTVFDMHIALALIAFVTFAIALTELSAFAFTFGLAVVLSGLCSLAVNRFLWAAFMSFAKDKGKFCNFKREEDDE